MLRKGWLTLHLLDLLIGQALRLKEGAGAPVLPDNICYCLFDWEYLHFGAMNDRGAAFLLPL